jgi:hypothetical protein
VTTARRLGAPLLAAAALVVSFAPVAQALRTDPNPQPLVGPIAVEPKYRNLAKLQDVVLGPMALEPTAGNLSTYINVTTAGGCPRGTNIVTRVYGPKLPKGGQNVIGNTYLYDYKMPPETQIKTPLTITLQEVVERQEHPVTLDGLYRIWMQCQDADMSDFSINYGVFEGKLRIKDGNYTSLTTLKDLPKIPSPKAGPEAFNSLAQKDKTPVVTPIPDPNDQLIRDAAAAANSKDSGGSSAGMAIGVMAGIVVLGLVPFAVLRRRTPAKARK